MTDLEQIRKLDRAATAVAQAIQGARSPLRADTSGATLIVDNLSTDERYIFNAEVVEAMPVEAYALVTMRGCLLEDVTVYRTEHEARAELGRSGTIYVGADGRSEDMARRRDCNDEVETYLMPLKANNWRMQ